MIYLLPQLVELAADLDADKPAFVCRDSQITYGDLAQRAWGLATTLRDLGVEEGDRVGILLGKSVETGIAIHGIMAAGAVYVPLDPSAPASRLAYVINDCGIRHIVSEHRKSRLLRALGEEGVQIESVIGVQEDRVPFPQIGWDQVRGDRSRPQTSVTEQDLAYILYTSGSTGTPKGITHTHRSALAWAEVSAATYGIGPDDRISNYAPPHFDLSTLDFFGGAKGAATVVMIPEEHMMFAASLASLIADERLTLFYTVPFALVQLAGDGVLDGKDLSSLQRVLFGGEPMPVKHLRTLMKRLPAARFFNVYGPTEVNGVTHHEVTSPPVEDRAAIPIGRPYANVEAFVADENDMPAESGEIGELFVRTPTMMRGYWRRDDLNANAFYFRQRHSGLPEVFHRTGDLANEDSDGVLHFHGRKDRQVKSRGYRIELDEVEAAMLSHPAIAEGAAFSVPSADGDVQIGGAVLARPGETVDPDSLYSHLAQILPAYALPESVEVMTSFPRTTSGKIDRRALAEMAVSRPQSDSEEQFSGG